MEQRKLEGNKLQDQRGLNKELTLLKVAKTLLSEGTAIAKISHLTGLTEAEIKNFSQTNRRFQKNRI